jgi:hypothetical protein
MRKNENHILFVWSRIPAVVKANVISVHHDQFLWQFDGEQIPTIHISEEFAFLLNFIFLFKYFPINTS